MIDSRKYEPSNHERLNTLCFEELNETDVILKYIKISLYLEKLRSDFDLMVHTHTFACDSTCGTEIVISLVSSA